MNIEKEITDGLNKSFKQKNHQKYNIRDVFTEQQKTSKTVTHDNINKISNKKYDNGNEIKIGDKILFAVVDEENGNNRNKNITFIKLNEAHFKEYVLHENYQGNGLPLLRRNKSKSKKL